MIKRVISLLTVITMLCASTGFTAYAEIVHPTVTVEADKTAQWTNVAADSYNGLYIHGYTDLERAGYIGFSLPKTVTADKVGKAELVVTTISGTAVSDGFAYSADYSDFENGVQYSEKLPAYTAQEIATFKTSTTANAEVSIDVTDAIIESIENADRKAAFRLDVRTSTRTATRWLIGSTSYGTVPKLVITSTEVSGGIEFTEKNVTIYTRESSKTLDMNIIGNYTASDLDWSSSDNSIVTVNDGVITPIKAGTATITATLDDISDICTVTVFQSAEGISLSQNELTLSLGETEDLSVTLSPENTYNRKVTWQSDDTAVATVSSNGIVTPVSVGTANITTTAADGGYSASCAVTVTENVPASGISLNKSSITLPEKGAEIYLEVTITPSNASNKDIVWTSDNEDVATVTDGVVTSVGAGTSTITATTADGNFSASCDITVTSVENTITNDTFWKDTDGNYIYSQGGGIFKFGDTYYWYGAHYAGAESYIEHPEWGGNYNSDTKTFKGFTCYTSKDLVNWKYEGYVMEGKDILDDNEWVGRMGVAYNANTGKYMLVTQKYPGIMTASADSPTGPFTREKQLNNIPYITNGSTGDQTVFMDDDGKAYLICSSAEGRQNLYVIPLTDDFDLDSENMKRIYYGATKEYIDENGDIQTKSDNGTEGDCMFKYNGHYYFTGSDLYGWNSSRVYVFESDSILGEYNIQHRTENQKLPYIMRNVAEHFAHNTQAGFYVTVKGSKQETVIYCGDRWADFAGNGLGYNQWVPLSFDEKGDPYFNNLSQWSFDIETGEWAVGAGNNYLANPEFDADRWTVAKPVGWQVEDSLGGSAQQLIELKTDKPGGYGTYTLQQKASQDYTASLKQTVSNLPDGKYILKALVKSIGGQNKSELYAEADGSRYTYSLKTAINDWTEIVIPNIEVKNGECEIGLYSDAYANNWVYLDNMSLVRSYDTEEPVEEKEKIYVIDNISLKSSSDAPISKAPVNESFKVNVEFTKNITDSENDCLIAAVYGTDNALIDIASISKTFDKGNNTHTFTIPAQNKEIGSIKVFVWDDWNSMKPLSAGGDLEINNTQ